MVLPRECGIDAPCFHQAEWTWVRFWPAFWRAQRSVVAGLSTCEELFWEPRRGGEDPVHVSAALLVHVFSNHSTQLNFYLSLYSLLLWSPDCYQRERLLNSTHQWNGTTWGAAITYQRGFRCLAELGKESGVGGWNSLNKNLHVDSLRADFVPQVQDYFEQSMQNSWIKIHSKSSFKQWRVFIWL